MYITFFIDTLNTLIQRRNLLPKGIVLQVELKVYTDFEDI
jgi:hypothetical protein